MLVGIKYHRLIVIFIDVFLHVALLRPSFDHTQQQQTTYFRHIYDSKDVIKLKSFLASAIVASRQDLGKVRVFLFLAHGTSITFAGIGVLQKI